MWHVETDFFALAIFLIMLVKEKLEKRAEHDAQSKAFFMVLIASIINVVIDIVSSACMNRLPGWWPYQLSMTVYVASMPLLAAVWVAYAYVLIHRGYSRARLTRNILLLMIPYFCYLPLAFSNPATELFFHLSADMEYARGPLFMPVGVGSIMLYSAMGLWLVVINRGRIRPITDAFLLVVFFVTTACFIWIQLANPGWLIINASYAIIYVWCDFSVEDQRKKRLYQELERKNKELEETARKAESAALAKTEFLSRMSHDIRTPMNAIIGLTHLARHEQNPERIQNYLESISDSSDFLLGLINDILDMSKIEDGELSLTEEPVTRDSFQRSVDTVIRPLMEGRQITFTCGLEQMPECIRVDRLRFHQIFFNLLSNAAKFTPEGGKVSFWVETSPAEEGRVRLLFHVKDNGIGISEAFLPHLYDPFSQEKTKLNASTTGTGLGLPIVKSLVDAMGGTIRVQSRQGEGTEFTVELPVALARREEEKLSEESPVISLQGMHLLLVEDNELNVYVAKALLENAGCRVDVAGNGQEAVEYFRNAPLWSLDAVLMDVRMPVMDGLEATRTIRAMKREDAAAVPIIAMTADAFDEEQKTTLAAGMNCHLSKPIDPVILYQTLAEYTGRSRKEKENKKRTQA